VIFHFSVKETIVYTGDTKIPMHLNNKCWKEKVTQIYLYTHVVDGAHAPPTSLVYTGTLSLLTINTYLDSCNGIF
jgi:hypothetical protein